MKSIIGCVCCRKDPRRLLFKLSRRPKEFIVFTYIVVAYLCVNYLQTTSYNRYKSIIEVYKKPKAKQTQLFWTSSHFWCFLDLLLGSSLKSITKNITIRLGIISKDCLYTVTWDILYDIYRENILNLIFP